MASDFLKNGVPVRRIQVDSYEENVVLNETKCHLIFMCDR